jgi:hypothetical protein
MRGLKSMLWEASVLDPDEVRPFNSFQLSGCNFVLRAYVSMA